ncbi:hypothetical protein [Halorarius halobius]|uniref:hypothetical protein n=1 Tax=Halorarius halobius TaxID=2962671 RepID=UPI0020CF5D93|nr:hypothetical protein [Halorarius halobius]
MSLPSRKQWEEVPPDPDLERDFGYDREPLTAIRTPEHTGQLILLPSEERQLEDDEFLVVDDGSVEPLSDWR